MRKYGEAMLDGTPLVYAVMEPTEMSLADLLQNRTLTVEEAKQLAASLLAALTALHASELVHEHIEPSTFLPRARLSNCAATAYERPHADPDGGQEAASRRKATDAHDLAVVLLQAMTGRRSLQGSATLLPSPVRRHYSQWPERKVGTQRDDCGAWACPFDTGSCRCP